MRCWEHVLKDQSNNLLKEKRKIKQGCQIVDNPWNQGRKNLYPSLKTFIVEKKEGMNDFEMVRCNTAKPRCPRLLIATLAAGFCPCSGSKRALLRKQSERFQHCLKGHNTFHQS